MSLMMGMMAGQMRAAGAPPASDVIGVALITAGGGGGTWAHVDIDGNTIATPDTAYFNAHAIWGAIADTTIDSQAMVTIPKFYVRRAVIASGANAGKEAWWIAGAPTAGFHLHSAFRDAGVDINQFYIGKYQASMQSTKLASVPGVLPVVSRPMLNLRADAEARNVAGQTGWMLWSHFQLSAIQWLYLIEQATMDSQARTGQGRVSATSAANVDAADVAEATYRGVVGLWGNVWQLVDGIKTLVGVVNLWDSNGNKTYVSTGITRTAGIGGLYPLTFMNGAGADWDIGDVFLGDTGAAIASATAPDEQYIDNSAVYFQRFGGAWNNGATAGLWNSYIRTPEGSGSSQYGGRVAKV